MVLYINYHKVCNRLGVCIQDKLVNKKTKNAGYRFIQKIMSSILNHAKLLWGLDDFQNVVIDHMHMTSQKGAHVRWGSNEALPRASLPSMQPGGQPLHATPPGWPARARALRGWVPMRTASTTRARCATLVWRRCYGDVTLCDVNA